MNWALPTLATLAGCLKNITALHPSGIPLKLKSIRRIGLIFRLFRLLSAYY
jgi:hypothetical protein